jgi:hypothetical protein
MDSGPLTSRGGTIAAGGTRQPLAARATGRRYLLIQNLDATSYLYVKFDGTATQDSASLRLSPGQTFTMEGSYCCDGAIDVVGPTTGQAFHALEGI